MKMAIDQKFLLPYFIITLFLISSFASSLNNDHLPNDNYFEQESGHDFRAYPSYFGHVVRGINFDNYSTKNVRKFGRSLKALVQTVNVLNFGAKGDGTTDDTKAFRKAWQQACSSPTNVKFMVPQNKNYLLKPIRFTGPCKSAITMQVSGTVVASNDRSDYSKDFRHWLMFESVQNLEVSGGGIIHGNGNVWWQNSCKINKAKPCTVAPTALTFFECTNLIVNNLKIKNGQQIQMSFEKCRNVEASNLVVNAPGNSPNTDGIHVTETQNIRISTSTIGTGDDCISIVSGSHKVRVTGITCGPGHGISIGSLGSGNSEAEVSDVVVNGAKLSGTSNGVRIKTWQGGSGSASNIKFQNIEMQNVENPIIIDQHYCDQDKPCKEKASAVQVKNIVYQNIKGTSASNVAIVFDCSTSHPCQGIVMQNVNLGGRNRGDLKAICNNVEFLNSGTFSPQCP
ncbi:hypothetical protein ACS0TY_024986 [Phlomoides rotata]